MRRKAIKLSIFALAITLLVFLFSTYRFSFTYFWLSSTHPEVSIEDYQIFMNKEIGTGDSAFYYKQEPENEQRFLSAFPMIEYQYDGQLKTGTLDVLFSDTGTTAFIVIKDDTIYFEEYGNGYSKEFSGTSFSVAKSFMSALTGIAISEGYFSPDDSIRKFIPELEGDGFDTVTIRDLLSMSSGIQFTKSDDYLLLHHMADESMFYRYPDLNELLLDATIKEPPQEYFDYSDYNPMYLTMIIERTTGRTLTDYMQEKMWQPMGMEYPATWSTDQNGFAKSAVGLNASAIDYAKFGSLYLGNGFFNGRQIIPSDWVTESVMPDGSLKERVGYYPDWIQESDLYYKYLWWGNSPSTLENHFFAWGDLGQYIYVVPEKNMVFVRQGAEYGLDDNCWPDVFEYIADRSDNF